MDLLLHVNESSSRMAPARLLDPLDSARAGRLMPPARFAGAMRYCEGADAADLDFLKSSSAFLRQSRCAASPDMFLQACWASASDPPFLLRAPAAAASSGVVVGVSRKVGWVGGVEGDGAVWAEG
ncbi:hypothetical protein [Piscinibacter sp. XHJ-5]|uniref:hypothetical protein n=1 Tax=Piscinibacter sp. XHJ-5 TaxID=3037797 RepID=UPI002452BBA4|nr:hypothetical protein [Piscinibacter sp. XHJ-5]